MDVRTKLRASASWSVCIQTVSFLSSVASNLVESLVIFAVVSICSCVAVLLCCCVAAFFSALDFCDSVRFDWRR